eukprot:superscaffoldBa00011417_g25204
MCHRKRFTVRCSVFGSASSGVSSFRALLDTEQHRRLYPQLGGRPSVMASVTCRVQYLEDSDPFICTNFPEPRRPPTVSLEENLPLSEQISGIHKLLEAPLKPRLTGLSCRWSAAQRSAASQLGVCGQVHTAHLAAPSCADEVRGYLKSCREERAAQTGRTCVAAAAAVVVVEEECDSAGTSSPLQLAISIRPDSSFIPDYDSPHGYDTPPASRPAGTPARL